MQFTGCAPTLPVITGKQPPNSPHTHVMMIMSIEDWRRGKWTGQDFLRLWMHFPVGVICAWLVFAHPMAGLVAALGFMFYEVLEDWRIKDLSFKDMLGFLIGFISASLLLSLFDFQLV